MADNVTSTGIDALLKYVNEHGETDILSLSRVLRIDMTIVEQWADILENARLVKINYKLDKMYVSPLTLTAVDLKAMGAEAEVREKTLASEISSKEALLSQMESRISQFDKFTLDAEKVFRANASGVKKTLDELHDLRIRADSEFAKIKSSKEYMDHMSEKMDADMIAVRKKVDAIKKGSFDAEDASKLIAEMKDRLKLIEAESNSTQKKLLDGLAGQRKEMEGTFEGVRQEIKSLRDVIAQEEKRVDDNARINRNYSTEVERILKDLDKRNSGIMDRAEKTRNDINSIYELAEKKTIKVNEDIDSYIKKFGELGDLDKTIRDIKESLENAKKECEYCRQQFALIDTQLKELEGNRRMDEATKNEKVKGISNKVAQINTKIEKIRQDIENATPEKVTKEDSTE